MTIKLIKQVLLGLMLLVLVPVSVTGAWSLTAGWPESWRTADWSSTQQAPDPLVEKEAIVQVYAARAGRWKGIFSVHSWIGFKPENAAAFTRFEVVGWGPPLRRNKYAVDARWYGNDPDIILEVRGEKAAKLIPRIIAAVHRYPYKRQGSYGVWPGPNSNTFIAWIARQVPELNLEMPANAIGKDYLGDGVLIGPTPSGSGFQLSLWGVFGVAIAWQEGLEVHVLGTTMGLDFDEIGVKLPGIGKLSFI